MVLFVTPIFAANSSEVYSESSISKETTFFSVLFKPRKAKNVIGVENNEAAVRDAEVNAKVNGVQNVRFLKGDAAEYMKKTYPPPAPSPLYTPSHKAPSNPS